MANRMAGFEHSAIMACVFTAKAPKNALLREFFRCSAFPGKSRGNKQQTSLRLRVTGREPRRQMQTECDTKISAPSPRFRHSQPYSASPQKSATDRPRPSATRRRREPHRRQRRRRPSKRRTGRLAASLEGIKISMHTRLVGVQFHELGSTEG